jgi:bacteriocin biosynthesis cyclodehydratase domain-containing protein
MQDGLGVELGPLVVPGESACYSCLQTRRRAAASVNLQARAGKLDGARLNQPLAVDWLTVETIKLLTGLCEPVTYGRLLTLDYLSGSVGLHPVLRLPRCERCGRTRDLPARKLWQERDPGNGHARS